MKKLIIMCSLMGPMLALVSTARATGTFFTIPESKLLTDDFNHKWWGPATSVLRTNVPGDAVRYDFTGLGGSGTGMKDDYMVDLVYGQAGGTHNGNFTNFDGDHLLHYQVYRAEDSRLNSREGGMNRGDWRSFEPSPQIITPITTLFDGPTLEADDLDMISGYFTVSLEFGTDVFDGNNRWLAISVRPATSANPADYVPLLPRPGDHAGALCPVCQVGYARASGSYRSAR